MKLQKLRDNCERDYEVDLVHQCNINGNVTVLIDKDGKVKVIRYHRDFNGLWQPTVMYDGDDVICGMAEFNKVLNNVNNVVVDPNTGIEFICPSCGHTILECCQEGYHVSRVMRIDPDGDHDYGELESHGEVDRWQCASCGYVLQLDGMDVTDNQDVAEAIKELNNG